MSTRRRAASSPPSSARSCTGRTRQPACRRPSVTTGYPAPWPSRSRAFCCPSGGRSEQLNSLGRWLGNTFYRVVKPGKAKDVLAGTWMAHPTHPMLTDVTIGAWTGAAILDVFGGEGGRHGADRLVGVGIVAAIPT